MPKSVAAFALSTSWPQVLALRLQRQHIDQRARADRLVDVVARMVGLHAQVMSSAELQAAARIDGLRPSAVRDALWEQRRLVKVWAFRQTLHLLTPDDLADFVVAARSLERWHTPAWLRYFKLSEREVGDLIAAVGAVLTERPMTRADLAAAVTERVRKPRLREALLTGWGTFLAPAAQRGHLVFGPSDGRNVAFVDPSAWLGRPIAIADDPAAADDALGRLIGRYLAVFPGASREMIARWWGGGRMTAVNRALALVPDEIAEVEVDGSRGLVRREDLDALAAVSPQHEVRLLPGFDPFTNELPRRVHAVLPDRHHDRVHRTAGWVTPIVVVDGRVAATWEIGNGKNGTVEVQPFERLSSAATKELKSEVERVAAFLERPLKAAVASPLRAD
ncbi:MAG TPA: winged helix DNA-binding domain-containing protein [Candidatus Limnocylindrales bacterium]|nr:winged helix DNA-binding domain-containing protein [Candidatus Limnocylindrales bacterium]